MPEAAGISGARRKIDVRAYVKPQLLLDVEFERNANLPCTYLVSGARTLSPAREPCLRRANLVSGARTLSPAREPCLRRANLVFTLNPEPRR